MFGTLLIVPWSFAAPITSDETNKQPELETSCHCIVTPVASAILSKVDKDQRL